MEIAARISGTRRLTPDWAVDQDTGVAGGDLEDFVEALAVEFGDQVWQWPWQRFAMLDEGLSPLFPLLLIWQLLTWPIRGRFSYPSSYERLTLRHIAKVISDGEWTEP